MWLADTLSLARVPLGLLFVWVAAEPTSALAVLVLAGLTDVLDGPVARHAMGAEQDRPHRGDWLDPLCDKLFVAAVVLGIFIARRPPVLVLVLVLTREWLQVLALAIWRATPAMRRSGPYNFRAAGLGKATTVAQFAAAAVLVLGAADPWPVAFVCAVLGAASVVVYVGRMRRALRAHAALPGPAA
jgi:phosphatidylglycerophosphate synthase